MSKFDPLKEFLLAQKQARVNMRFSDIEKLGIALPASAKKHRPWWANNKHHTQANAWLDAGFETEQVDMGSQKLTFVKFVSRGAGEVEPREAKQSASEDASLHEKLEDMELKLSTMESELAARNREIEAQQAIIESQANRLSEKTDKLEGGSLFAAFAAGALTFGFF